MAQRIPREAIHQRVWFTPTVTARLSEKERVDVAEYLEEHRATTSLWDSDHPMRRQTRFRALFRQSLR
jgi:hypothetical protein